MVLGEPEDKLGEKAYRIRLQDEDDDTISLAKRFAKLRLGPKEEGFKEESEEEFSDSDEETLSYTQSPVPDDTKCELQFWLHH